MFARHFAKLPPKPGLDAYTTMQIVNVRAAWAMDESKDVIASADGANWTVCMDRELSLKEAVQSRTIFLDRSGLLAATHSSVGAEGADGRHGVGRSRTSHSLCRSRHASRRGPLRSARAS